MKKEDLIKSLKGLKESCHPIENDFSYEFCSSCQINRIITKYIKEYYEMNKIPQVIIDQLDMVNERWKIAYDSTELVIDEILTLLEKEEK